jgi:hypothetical protein
MVENLPVPEPLTGEEMRQLLQDMGQLLGGPFTALADSLGQEGRISLNTLPLGNPRAAIQTSYSGETPVLKPWLFAEIQGEVAKVKDFFHEYFHYSAMNMAVESPLPSPINETYAKLGELCYLHVLARLRPTDEATQQYIAGARSSLLADTSLYVQRTCVELGFGQP